MSLPAIRVASLTLIWRPPSFTAFKSFFTVTYFCQHGYLDDTVCLTCSIMSVYHKEGGKRSTSNVYFYHVYCVNSMKAAHEMSPLDCFMHVGPYETTLRSVFGWMTINKGKKYKWDNTFKWERPSSQMFNHNMKPFIVLWEECELHDFSIKPVDYELYPLCIKPTHSPTHSPTQLLSADLGHSKVWDWVANTHFREDCRRRFPTIRSYYIWTGKKPS